MNLELLVIRHGESEANIGRSTDVDCPLSENGLEQARLVARRVSRCDLRGFVGLTSPYRRALQTAAEVTKAAGLEFAVDESIREWAAAATINGRHYPAESGQQLVARLGDFLARHDGRKLVVISHAAPIAVLIQLAWGEVPNTEGAFWAGVPNGCLRWLKTTP